MSESVGMGVRLAFAVLADHAVVHPQDGKFYITGGGVEQLAPNRLPWTLDRLSVATELEFDRAAWGAEHLIAITTVNPAGQPFSRAITIGVIPDAPPDSPVPLKARFVSTLTDLAFDALGVYEVRVSVDAHLLATLPIRVVLQGQPTTPGQPFAQSVGPPWDRELALGFQAYNAGEVDRAEDLFRAVVERYPGVPAGHNNLGFILLGRGDADSAAEQFEHALNGGYSYPELLQVNLGCCAYVARRYADALEHFTSALTNPRFQTGGVLYLANAGDLQPVHVESMGSFVALVALCAGWASLGQRDQAGVEHWLRLGRSMLDTVGPGTEASALERLQSSADALEANNLK